jgi:hypothetical protein
MVAAVAEGLPNRDDKGGTRSVLRLAVFVEFRA